MMDRSSGGVSSTRFTQGEAELQLPFRKCVRSPALEPGLPISNFHLEGQLVTGFINYWVGKIAPNYEEGVEELRSPSISRA